MKARTSTSIRLSTAATLLGMGVSIVLAAQARSADTIDILVLYTPGTAERYNGRPETRINHLFNVSNQAYKDSGLDLRIRPVHMRQVAYPDDTSSSQALRDMTFRRHAAFTNVEQVRSEYGADMVLLYRPYSPEHGNCGVAWIGGYNRQGDFSASWIKSYMYGHVSISTCGDYITSHELGHNMGLNHSRLQDGRGGTLDYALGYGEYNNFVTLMAYQSSFNVNYWSGKIYKFSSPELTCNGRPCGIDKNDPVAGADAVSALRITTPQIADFFPTKVIEQPLDTNPARLKAILDQSQATYNQRLQDYRSAVTEMQARRTASQKALAGSKKYRADYLRSHAAYRAAAQSYVQARRQYNAIGKSASASVRQSAYQAMQQRRTAYLTSQRTMLASRNSYLAAVAKVRTAASQYKQALEVVKTARGELNQARTELVAARRSYINAGGVV